MRKTLYSGLLTMATVLTGILTGSATAADTAARDVIPVADVVSPAVAGLPALHAAPADAMRGPVSVLGDQGGTELLGGTIAAGLLVQYVRRRRLI